jgi:predicted transposase YbfD/YdcC
MGCQQEIANQITEQKGDYLLAVKNNQPALFEVLEDTFKLQERKDVALSEELDFGHGRIENRTCFISSDLQHVDTLKWKDAKTLIKIVPERYNKTKQIQEEPMIRYYISSLEADAKMFNTFIRQQLGHREQIALALGCDNGRGCFSKKS